MQNYSDRKKALSWHTSLAQRQENKRPLSDIDIGIYLSSRLTKVERIYKRLESAAELSGFLKTNIFDLIIIKNAFPVINFEIIKPNVPVFVKSEDLKLDAEQKIMSCYWIENIMKTS